LFQSRTEGEAMKEYICVESPNEVEGGMLVREQELIRCKDCKYNSNTEGNYVNCDIIPQMFGKTPDYNYCSWAEPKDKS
jgi:DNA-directed RNA polymerase subunit RPC12/RpoP